MNEPNRPANAVTLHEAHSYRRSPPALAGCWCPDPNLLAYFYNVVRQRDAHCPAEYMLPLERGYVLGAQYVLDAGRQWIGASVTDFPGAEAALPGVEQRIAKNEAATLGDAAIPTVVIAKAGSSNYGHTLTEILPRLVNLWRSPLRTVRLLLPDGMRGLGTAVQLVLDRLGLTAELVFAADGQLHAVDNLVFMGPVSLHNVRKSGTLLSLRDIVLQGLGVTPQPQRRLYVERPPGEQRGLSNAAEARAVLEDAGYETVHPAKLPFAEQVALFGQASHIIGSMGAGLTNMLFAPRSCRVTMIDPGLADYFFWDLAALSEQPFTWMFTGPVSFYSPALEAASYPVDLDGLRYVLRQAG